VKFGVIVVRSNVTNVFADVAETLHQGLLTLGHDSVVTRRWLLDRRLIVLCPHRLPLLGVEPPIGSILYNLEPVRATPELAASKALVFYRRYPMWDYSARNIARLTAMGVPAPRWLPVGYVPTLTRIGPAAEDIDVLFYGSMTVRRQAALDALRGHGLHVEALYGAYGTTLDRFIARSKVVLNLHKQVEDDVFEVVRVSYLLANKKAVVSERGDGHEAFAGGVAFAAYDGLADECVRLVRDDAARIQLEERGFEIMSARRETDYLRTVLGSIA
jgi:hypothetical protein